MARKPMNHENATKNLLELKKILDETKIKFWLTCGTLLGALRDGNFISYDWDIDLLSLAGDWSSTMFPKLKKNGFSLYIRETEKFYPHGFYKVHLIKRKIPISIFLYLYYVPKDLFVYPRIKGSRRSEIPADFLKKEVFIRFLETEFRVPYKSEKLLTWMYGKTWRKPQQTPNWKSSLKQTKIPKLTSLSKIEKWISEHPKEAMRGSKTKVNK